MKNKGPGQVMNVTVYISWPYEVESGYSKGKHLLYLMEAPQINGNRVSEQSPMSSLCRVRPPVTWTGQTCGCGKNVSGRIKTGTVSYAIKNKYKLCS